MLWYFAAKHTKLDCFEKRGKKGYIFTIGDADCHASVSDRNMQKIFSDDSRSYTLEELAEMASEKYKLFHIHITSHSRAPANLAKVLGGRLMTIGARNISVLPEVIVSTLLMDKGQSLDEVLKNWDKKLRPVIAKTLGGLRLEKGGVISF